MTGAQTRRTRRTPSERRDARAQVDDPAVVMEAAAAFLAVRPRSVEETRRRLVRLGYRAELVDEVVGRLLELEYLDDAQFARAWVESRDRAHPRGESGLRRELALKGINRDVVQAVLAGRAQGQDGSADRQAAEALLHRRRASLEREPDLFKRRQKAYALLARNGFDPEVCGELSRQLVDSA